MAIQDCLKKVLGLLAKKRKTDFAGMGLLIYDPLFLKEIPVVPLRPSIKCPKDVIINNDKVISYLLTISDIDHRLHDGFHFFNCNGKLTHLSQYLAPPIFSKNIYTESNGSRYLTALYASYIKGVIATGIITQNNKVYYFEKGRPYNMTNQWDEIYKNKKENYRYYDLTQPYEDMAKLVKIFKKSEIKKVLDLGCGSGRNLIYLVEKGFEVYGLDISEEGIKKTQRNLRRKKLQSNLTIGDVFEKLPFPDNYFDAIVSVQTLQHGTENQIRKATHEIKRILKPKGLLFVTLCGRVSKGQVRYCLVKTAKKIAPRTYLPTLGDETGLTHYIYDKKTLLKHYKNFKLKDLWRDSKDYYCFLGENRKND